MKPDEMFAVRLFVVSHTIQHGYPPTIREVAEVRGISQYRAQAALYQIKWEGRTR